ncbi:MAG: RNA polymerase sigma factor [Clostridia bacterium]|nr:RNA polymerase sigma factor [Clostridia bacterium]
MDDRELIELYFARDESAIKLTADRYGKYCFAIANNILASSEDAEEVVNETYLRAWNAIPPQKPAVFRLFLARITRNLSLNRYEKRNAKKRGGEAELALEELSECTAGSVSVDGELMKHELEKAVNVFLDGLPERERSIFLRRYFRFESNAEIAERFGISVNNLAVALSRTRKKLRKHLEKEGYFK